MKKFIFTANLIALIALVPAVIVGYLHNNDNQSEANKDKTVIVRETSNRNDDGTTLHMVRTF
jgi:hypothetical protein